MLWQENGIYLADEARKEGLSKSILTPILRSLEKSGYIRRELLHDNDRTKSMILTEKGKNFAVHAIGISEHALCGSGLSEFEVKKLI